MKVFAGLLFFLFFSILVNCQVANSNLYYWIKFKDKSNNGFTLSNPSAFLSQQSINRRTQQGIAIDSSDLPVTQVYIDSISPYTNRLVHRLKWFNMIVVEIDNPVNLLSLKHFSFIDSVAPIASFPYKSLLAGSKFESAIPVDQQIVYPDIHGAAYEQLSMMNGDLLHQMGYRGQGIIISLMDNGLVGTGIAHAFDSVRPRILDEWDFVNNQPDLYYDPGNGSHGTATFSCIAGNVPNYYVGSAPEASFCLFQSEDNSAEWVMEEYNWAAAAERADSDGAQIFSTSLGYTTFDNDIGDNTYADLTGNTAVMTMAGNIASSKGIIVFNSAGNDGDDNWYYISVPADGDSIIAVGAVDSNRYIAPFSSNGPNSSGRIKPDLCAQGYPAYVVTSSGDIGAESGTSFSCPTLAGCAASLWSAFPGKTAKDIQTAIMMSADRYMCPNNQYGYGVPNFYNAYLLLETGFNTNLLQTGNSITVYPNPFSAQLNVSFYGDTAGNHTIRIFDLQGREVYSGQFYVRNKTYELVPIDTAFLADGVYILSFDNSKQNARKIVKMK
jgi:hypothetical protein